MFPDHTPPDMSEGWVREPFKVPREKEPIRHKGASDSHIRTNGHLQKGK